VKKKPHQRPPIVFTLNNAKRHYVNINDVVSKNSANMLGRTLASTPSRRTGRKTRTSKVSSGTKGSSVGQVNIALMSSEPEVKSASPNDFEVKKLLRLINLKKRVLKSELQDNILRNKRATTFQKVKYVPARRTPLFKQAARRPFTKILVDPTTGRIIKRRTKKVRIAPPFQLPNRHKRRIKTKL
tara:strand:+ start:215 stop:769 length:555 start_codon:yes stop_codon:yes gene_type:complete